MPWRASRKRRWRRACSWLWAASGCCSSSTPASLLPAWNRRTSKPEAFRRDEGDRHRRHLRVARARDRRGRLGGDLGCREGVAQDRLLSVDLASPSFRVLAVRRGVRRGDPAACRIRMNIARWTIRILITLLLLAGAGAAGWYLWDYYMLSPWTRDGRVRADVIEVAPDVAGIVTEVRVEDNATVAAGDVLFVIDKRRYEIALRENTASRERRRAALAQAQRDL